MQKVARLSSEPTVHFFAVALVLVLAQRFVVGDPRTIVVTPALKADLIRRLQDQLGRPPDEAEAAAHLRMWKRDEALYREALREGIDRDDPAIRNLLIGKMRERAMLRTPLPEPSESDLQEYLERHRGEFEAPLIYEHEYVVFPKNEPGAEQRRAKYERELKAGASTAALGLRSVAANVNRERIEQEFGIETAKRICELPIGYWQELETQESLLLVRMIRVEGGLPKPEVLHERLVASWKASMQQGTIDRATQAVADQYRFEEPGK